MFSLSILISQIIMDLPIWKLTEAYILMLLDRIHDNRRKLTNKLAFRNEPTSGHLLLRKLGRGNQSPTCVPIDLFVSHTLLPDVFSKVIFA